eukprot:TRINITY_DN14134_c0_g1_i1.p1 TRINITY_DN14134_c0_g1~~TRINITY_DN14134_c0_g1_i1.p1  ORF type:complete len:383 (-),score=127.17 TRINITY_DN14134_c0_g1_i1:21-1169(-)
MAGKRKVAFDPAKDEEQFAERKVMYDKTRASDREIYEQSCQRLGVKPNSACLKFLDSYAGRHEMKEVSFQGNYIGSVNPFLDLFRMTNGIRKLLLRANGLTNASLGVLVPVLVKYQATTLEAIDVCENKDLSLDGGKALKVLAKSCPRLISIRVLQTNIPSYLKMTLQQQIEANYHSGVLARAEFMRMRRLFHDIDTDGSGTVNRQELCTYELTKLKDEFGSVESHSSPSYKKLMKKEYARRMRQAKEMFDLLDKDASNTVTFEEYLASQYPKLSVSDIRFCVRKYAMEATQEEAAGGASSYMSREEICHVFDKYDADGSGSITLQELCEGLKIPLEDLQEMFDEYDWDANDTLDLNEFCFLMAVKSEDVDPGNPRSMSLSV